MKRILSLLIFIPCLAFGQQTSALQKGLIFHAPLSEWRTQPGAQLTSGTLTVGVKYTIGNYVSNDDFTNVGATSNASGVSFVATGTTPTHWAHSSVLRAQNYSATDLISGTAGTITDAYPVMGKDGSGRRWYEFDGVNDYIQLADNNNYDFGDGSFTVILRGAIKTSAVSQVLITKQAVLTATSVGFSIYARTSSPYINAFISDGTDYKSFSTNNVNYSDNVERTYVLVVDRIADNMKLYVNGSLIETTAGSLSLVGSISNSDPVRIGISNASATPLNGSTSRVQLFNRALSAAEVLAYQNDNTPLTFADRGATNTGATSGTLTVGKKYIITTFVSGDDFTNVGATSNATGVSFVATGTTPTTWTNGSTLTTQGNTLTLSASGMNSTYWYDYDHSVSGTVSGATLSIPTASNLGAYAFNGTTSAIAYSGMNGLTGDMSISAWIYATGWGEGDAGRIFDNGQTQFITSLAVPGLRFTRNNSTYASSNIGSITIGSWFHVVATSTSAGVTNYYINGTLSGTANQPSGTPVLGTTWYVGNRAAGDRTLDGRISDLRIYNRIISTEEITALYNGVR